MKHTWMFSAALAAALCLSVPAMAQDTLNLPGVGKMNVPQHITFQKGQQEALPFLADGGIGKFFKRKGLTEGTFYTMTYSQPPDYTYGWAISQKLGIPFLFAIGEISHKEDSPEEMLDFYADYFNEHLIEDGAIFTGETPLVKNKDKKNLRWEGSFILPRKEKNITYREAYQVVLSCDGYFTTLGVICTDGDQKEVTEAIQKMVQKRKLPERSKLLDLSKRGTSLTRY